MQYPFHQKASIWAFSTGHFRYITPDSYLTFLLGWQHQLNERQELRSESTHLHGPIVKLHLISHVGVWSLDWWLFHQRFISICTPLEENDFRSELYLIVWRCYVYSLDNALLKVLIQMLQYHLFLEGMYILYEINVKFMLIFVFPFLFFTRVPV